MRPMKRRDFLKAGGSAAALTAATLRSHPHASHHTAQPNILFLMTDQHRGDCLGCEGHPVVRTPNLDRLATEGARFSRAYVSIPSCLPARQSRPK